MPNHLLSDKVSAVSSVAKEAVEGMSAEARADLFAALLAKKAEIENTGGAPKLLTPKMSASVDRRNGALIRQIRARCGSVGFNLKDDELVDMAELNKCLKESSLSVEDKLALKSNMALVSLIR